MLRKLKLNSVAGIALTISCTVVKSQLPSSDLKAALSRQHFSGELRGNVHFLDLGTLRCGSTVLRPVFYEWSESSHPGRAVHASYRVILMKNGTYIGSYVVEDKPVVSGSDIRFPYSPTNGNTIHCEATGAPAQVVLDGSITRLQK